VVESVGEGVTSVKPGDHVSPTHSIFRAASTQRTESKDAQLSRATVPAPRISDVFGSVGLPRRPIYFCYRPKIRLHHYATAAEILKHGEGRHSNEREKSACIRWARGLTSASVVDQGIAPGGVDSRGDAGVGRWAVHPMLPGVLRRVQVLPTPAHQPLHLRALVDGQRRHESGRPAALLLPGEGTPRPSGWSAASLGVADVGVRSQAGASAAAVPRPSFSAKVSQVAFVECQGASGIPLFYFFIRVGGGDSPGAQHAALSQAQKL
jgi:hypothetical protein